MTTPRDSYARNCRDWRPPGGGEYLNTFEGTGTCMFEGIAKLLGFTDEIYVILRFWVKDMQKLFDYYFVL